MCFPNPTKAGPFKRSGIFVPPHNHIDILLYLGVWLGILGGPRRYRRLKERHSSVTAAPSKTRDLPGQA